MLVVGAEDDPAIVGHTWFHLLTENNLMPEGLGDDDDEDEDEDEDEDDEDDDDPDEGEDGTVVPIAKAQ